MAAAPPVARPRLYLHGLLALLFDWPHPDAHDLAWAAAQLLGRNVDLPRPAHPPAFGCSHTGPVPAVFSLQDVATAPSTTPPALPAARVPTAAAAPPPDRAGARAGAGPAGEGSFRLGATAAPATSAAAVGPDALDEWTVALLTPGASLGRFAVGGDWSAFHATAVVAVCMVLMAQGPPTLQGYFSRLVAHFGVILPTSFPAFCESSVAMLARFALHETDDIHLAARLLLQGVLERQTPASRAALVTHWAGRLGFGPAAAAPPAPPAAGSGMMQREPVSTVGDTVRSSTQTLVAAATAVLGEKDATAALIDEAFHYSAAYTATTVRGTEGSISRSVAYPELAALLVLSGLVDHLTPAHLVALTDALVAALCISPLVSPSARTAMASSLAAAAAHAVRAQFDAADVVRVALAADLLAREAKVWSNYLPDPTALLRCLLVLSLHSRPLVSQAASRAMIELGKINQRAFVTCMAAQALHLRAQDTERAAALLALVALAKKHPAALLRVLPGTVETVVRCLDPSHPVRCVGGRGWARAAGCGQRVVFACGRVPDVCLSGWYCRAGGAQKPASAGHASPVFARLAVPDVGFSPGLATLCCGHRHCPRRRHHSLRFAHGHQVAHSGRPHGIRRSRRL